MPKNDETVMIKLSYESFQSLMVAVGSVLNSAKWTDHHHLTLADMYDLCKKEEADFLLTQNTENSEKE